MPRSQTNRLLGICFETCFLASTRISSCLKNMTTVGFVSRILGDESSDFSLPRGERRSLDGLQFLHEAQYNIWTSQTSIIEKLCRNKERLPRNDAEVRQRPNNQLRVGSSKLQKLASVKSSAVPAPRDLSGLRARIEKPL